MAEVSAAPPPPPLDAAVPEKTAAAPSDADQVNPPDFNGSVLTNNTLPTAETLQGIADLPVLDRLGQSHAFSSLLPAAPGERVLVLFVRHFFCGNCQEYLRVLSEEIPPQLLDTASSPPPRIVVIGCGEPPLIDMYAEASACAYPIYADPTRKLYDALGMVSTLAFGQRPGYMMGRSFLASVAASIAQGLRQLPKGLASKGGNQRQVGGEFLFASPTSVTWCHRMRTTRDHAEVPELRQVLGIPETAAADSTKTETAPDAGAKPSHTTEKPETP